jgi:hypothetical protein
MGKKKTTARKSTTAKRTSRTKTSGKTTARTTAARKTTARGSQSREAKVTTDHDEIRRWVEGRGGKPATVKSTHKNGDPGLLRIDFPGYSGTGSLESISWDDFFKKFDEKKLAFLYQEALKSGQQSRFHKLVSRSTASKR